MAIQISAFRPAVPAKKPILVAAALLWRRQLVLQPVISERSQASNLQAAQAGATCSRRAAAGEKITGNPCRILFPAAQRQDSPPINSRRHAAVPVQHKHFPFQVGVDGSQMMTTRNLEKSSTQERPVKNGQARKDKCVVEFDGMDLMAPFYDNQKAPSRR
ncbi:MAG: hypothetical protein HY298_25220 [Verrucomicrobia bacterium]|nr:hypothetical protein [Verrucomicrobiota bacterium]